ncbi:unnamed protein product, partial [Polarella glacialis]
MADFAEGTAAAWLFGAFLSQLAAIFSTLGHVFIRKATFPPARADDAPPAGATSSKDGASFHGKLSKYSMASEINSAVVWDAWTPAASASTTTTSGTERLPLSAILCSPYFSLGLGLRGVAVLVWWTAGCYAPVTTVAPLFLAVSVFSNLACGPSLLREQYRTKEVLLCLACMCLLVVDSAFDSDVIDPWLEDSTWIVNLHNMQTGQGHAILACSFLWCAAVVFFSLEVIKQVFLSRRLRSVPQASADVVSARYAIAVPALAGLMSGAAYFEGYVGLPVCAAVRSNSWMPSARGTEQVAWALASLPVAAVSVLLSVEGARSFDCRYFVPAYGTVGFFTASVMRVLLVQKQRAHSWATIIGTCLAHLSLLVLPFFISSKPTPIKLPHTLKWDTSPQSSSSPDVEPFRHGTVDPLPLIVTPLLELYDDEEGKASGILPDPLQQPAILKLHLPKDEPSQNFFHNWTAICLWLPVSALAVVPLSFFLLFIFWLQTGGSHGTHPSLLHFSVAIYTIVMVVFPGLRTAVFSSVARWRISLCTATDYEKLCQIGRKRRCVSKKHGRFTGGGGRAVVLTDPFDTPGSSSSEDDDETFWQTVRHFVVVEGCWQWPTASQSVDELRALLNSICASSIAAKQ